MTRYTGQRPFYSGSVTHEKAVKSAADTSKQVQFVFGEAMKDLFHETRVLPHSIAELRDALGGTNKAAAAIGVTPRSIQRYIAAEEHRSSQTRRADYEKRAGIIERLRGVLGERLTGKLEEQISEKGVSMEAHGSVRLAPDYTEARRIRWLIQSEYWTGDKGILAAWAAGRERLAAQRFQRAFAKSWGQEALPGARWTHLSSLTLTIPQH